MARAPGTGRSRRRFWLYLVRTRLGTLYTGIAVDVARRMAQHATGRGARALRGRAPLQLAYSCAIGAVGVALRVERRVKQLPRRAKEQLIAQAPDRRALLRRLGCAGRAPRKKIPGAPLPLVRET